MRSNICVSSDQLDEKDIESVIRAILACKKENFEAKKMDIILSLPELSQTQCQAIVEKDKLAFPDIHVVFDRYPYLLR